MAIIQNDKRRKELERLYSKPSLQLNTHSDKKPYRNSVVDDFLTAYRPTLMKDAFVSIITLFVLILFQLVLVRFLK
ncbi:MAG: hypothetical protein NUV65_06510 [Candidatus Roizmanbacteria bacterium]|nr:hypothetical protein [Candidatus Roizmanbacteria bacterium]